MVSLKYTFWQQIICRRCRARRTRRRREWWTTSWFTIQLPKRQQVNWSLPSDCRCIKAVATKCYLCVAAVNRPIRRAAPPRQHLSPIVTVNAPNAAQVLPKPHIRVAGEKLLFYIVVYSYKNMELFLRDLSYRSSYCTLILMACNVSEIMVCTRVKIFLFWILLFNSNFGRPRVDRFRRFLLGP